MKNWRRNIYLARITTYECKIYKILSIRIKAEQFTTWKYDYRPMDNLTRPDPRTILLKFDINHRKINSKHFQISYFGDTYLTSNICLILGCDISMLVKDDGPDRWNSENRNFKILIYKSCRMYLINFNFTTSHRESVHIVSMKPPDPWWPCKETSVLPQKQMRKCQTDGQKLCDKTFCYQLTSWDTQY